jgi:hypothetical protein
MVIVISGVRKQAPFIVNVWWRWGLTRRSAISFVNRGGNASMSKDFGTN